MKLLRDQVFTGGLRPRTPGIYCLPARMAGFGGGQGRPRPFRLLSRRSGCVPAVPYPPLRYSQSGKHQPRRAILFQRTATTPLTRCLTPGVHFKREPNPRPVPVSNHQITKSLNYPIPNPSPATGAPGPSVPWPRRSIRLTRWHPPSEKVLPRTESGSIGWAREDAPARSRGAFPERIS